MKFTAVSLGFVYRVSESGVRVWVILSLNYSDMYAKTTTIIRAHRVERQGTVYARKKVWKVSSDVPSRGFLADGFLVRSWGASGDNDCMFKRWACVYRC